MIKISTSDDYATIAVNEPFYLEYYTAAHRSQSIEVSSGITVLEDVQVKRPTDDAPGSSMLWRMKLVLTSREPQQIYVSIHSPIPSVAKQPKHIIHINQKCMGCHIEEPIWKRRNQLFCSVECAGVAESIQYISTGYIDGTRINLVMEKLSSGDTYIIRDLKAQTKTPMSRQDGERAWMLAEKYVNSGVMHPETQDDKPQCCDRGVTRILFRGYAAEPKDVSELAVIFLNNSKLNKK